MAEDVHASKLSDGASASEEVQEIQEALSTSESGAPAAGEIVRDIFTTDEIFRRLVATADEEFSVPARLLFLSGLAAGLAASLSFLGTASLAGALPPDSRLIYALLYPLGFIFVAVGRYQLFTENTLTPVVLVLTRIASIPRLLHIWGIVLVANLLGTLLAAFFFAKTGIFEPNVEAGAIRLGKHFAEMEWNRLFFSGILAGWLVAGMVWLNHAAGSTTARLLIVFGLMYTVGAAGLAHCIVGSTEVLFLVFKGQATFGDYLLGFEVPVVLGNILGGVLLVALINYGLTRDKRFADPVVLTWREWLIGERNREDKLDGAPSDSRD